MEMTECLLNGGSRCRTLARRGPILDRPLRNTCLRPVMSDEFRYLSCNLGMRRTQRVGDMLMQLPARAAQHALISSIPEQLVPKTILDRFGRTRCADEAGLDKLDEGRFEIVGSEP